MRHAGSCPRWRTARVWPLEVHALRKELLWRVAPGIEDQPERHTLLPLPSRVVIPGSNFREVYCRDTYIRLLSGYLHQAERMPVET